MSDHATNRPADPLPSHPDVLLALFKEAERYIINMKNWLPRLKPHLVDGGTPEANPLLAALDLDYARIMDHWRDANHKERLSSVERLKWDTPDVGFPPRLKRYISGPGDEHRLLEDLKEGSEQLHRRASELARTEDEGHPVYQRAFVFALLELKVGKVEKLRDRIAAKLDEPSRKPMLPGAGVDNECPDAPETPGDSPGPLAPPSAASEIDFEAIAIALAKKNQRGPSKLVSYMSAKQSAQLDYVLYECTNGNTREAVKSLVNRTNNELLELKGPLKSMASRLKFRISDALVFRDIKPG
jgi:hypothetical protein